MRRPAWALIAAAVLLVALLGFALWFYFGVVMPSTEAPTWGSRGDSVAPFVALLNAGALAAALWAVHLQRVELSENRTVLRDQQKELERAALAQQEANREAAQLRLAQHSSTIATMDSALAVLDAAAMLAYAFKPVNDSNQRGKLENRRQAIGTRIHIELAAEAELRAKLGLSIPGTVAETKDPDA